MTALDTIAVSGRPVSVSNASIFLDDQLADKSVLRTGMQVILQRQNGSATDLYYEEDVKGPVDAVEATGNLSVMGQSVIVSTDTMFDNAAIGGISVGDIVEVSGLRDNSGLLHATFVENKQSTPNAFEVQGPVTQLDISNRSFVIGNLLIDYSGARFDDISEASLAAGVFVEVKDENLIYEPGSFSLRATKIERYRDVLTVSNSPSSNSNSLRTEIEIEAFVTRIISDDVFQLGGLSVRILPTTRFRGGERHQLQVNTRLEVEGWLNSNGELEAWEIEFEDGSDYFDSDDDSLSSSSGSSDNDDSEVELEGIVSAMKATAGIMVINGIEVRVDSRTEFENGQDERITRSQFFNLLQIGSTVVKVKWKRFSSYTEAPHEVEIEV